MWKRWLDGPTQGAAVRPDGLRVTLKPGDPESLQRVVTELPVVLTLSSADDPELEGIVLPGRVDDVFEILVSPGRYALSVFVFDDDSLTTIAGVGWEHEMPVYPGYDAELSLAVLSGFDELAQVIIGEALGTIVFSTGESIDLSAAFYLLGRDPACDVEVRHDSVSRRHAGLSWTDRGWVVEDCGSVNGTTVNGHFVEAAYLEDGDIVGIGEIWFRLFYAD